MSIFDKLFNRKKKDKKYTGYMYPPAVGSRQLPPDAIPVGNLPKNVVDPKVVGKLPKNTPKNVVDPKTVGVIPKQDIKKEVKNNK